MKKIFVIYVTVILIIVGCSKNKQQNTGAVIGFYNLENLFDTINSTNVNDVAYTPNGIKKWNSIKYNAKLNNIAEVIGDIGVEEGFNGPSVIGVCEVESKAVLKDLLSNKSLANKMYKIIHYDSPDKRGIDVALLYKPEDFVVARSQKYPLIIYDFVDGSRIYTRDQLLVEGTLKGDYVYIIVSHWPSRFGGEYNSRHLRYSAAKLNRSIIDSILNINKRAKIITMGDFNDNPKDLSLKKILQTCTYKNCGNNSDCLLFNPMEEIHKSDSVGSLKYRGKWNLFDQILISKSLIKSDNSGLVVDTIQIYNKPYLYQKDGKYSGYLLRTFAGSKYLGGYSDHLPVYLVLKQ